MASAIPTTAAPAREPHTLVIRPKSGFAALDLGELWEYRDLLRTLAERDVKLRYRQTALGAIWVVFQPLLGALIFSVVFKRVAAVPSDGIPYFVFAFAGFMAYNIFSATLSKASLCLVQNSQLVSKVFFPRLVLPLSTSYGSIIDFGVSLFVLAILMAVYHVAPTLALLTLPLWVGLITLLALGFGLVAAAVTVTYRDVQYALPVLIQFGLYAAPVGYPVRFALEKLPAGLRPFYLLNPLTGLLDAFRWSLLGAPIFNWRTVAFGAVASIVIFLWGAFSFKRMERRFADVI